MNITFDPLVKLHFPMLLMWLQTPHIKAWWDQNVQWTSELIEEKFRSYTKSYKMQDGIAKKLHAYIICVDAKPIGYIQLYNAYDFPRKTPLNDLPKSLAAVDIFIGDPAYLSQNIGCQAILLFTSQHCAPKYEYTFVDPEIANIAAIKSYTKAGFEKIRLNESTNEIWMLKKNTADKDYV